MKRAVVVQSVDATEPSLEHLVVALEHDVAAELLRAGGETVVDVLRHALPEARVVPRVRSHCRFRKRGIDYLGESGIKQMSGITKR